MVIMNEDQLVYKINCLGLDFKCESELFIFEIYFIDTGEK